MSTTDKTIVITRFDPDQDEKPRQQEYKVPCEPAWKVLDAVNFIKDELDSTVSHRWSCRMAVCGSCGMMVNGEPKLTCKTALSDYGDRVVIEPLANFPIVRDLVVELDGFMHKFESVKPWIVRAKERAEDIENLNHKGTYSQSAEELATFKQFSHVYQLHALLRGLSGRRERARVPRPRGDRPGTPLQHGHPRSGRSRAERHLPRRGHRLQLLLRQRMLRSLSQERRPCGRRQPGEVRCRDRLGEESRLAPRRSQLMAGPAHPHAMAPPTPGRTRTAPPQMPTTWWSAPRIRTYLLFDLTGVIYFLVAFVAIRLIGDLGRGELAWDRAMESLQHPLYIAFHLLCLVSVIFVAVRFFRLFPKAQPPAIGPLKPPPGNVIHGMLYVVWIGVSLIMTLILAGVLF